ncbi:MAG TPA: DUF805 domain-containing protein [Rhizomicrobium sp.]|jgi:uncharacterized membrane protein YhaH (DUF805 family)
MGDVDFNKLWQNFVDTLTNHYFDFNGRVGRSQFWSYVVVWVVLAILVGIIGSITTRLISSLFSLALLLPNLGMGVRRLHDVGKPGIYVLLPLVPAVLAMLFLFLFLWPLAMLCWLAVFAAGVLLIYWYAQPGMAGDNEYGPPPANWPA